jgi:hypothetical protein
VVVGISRDEDKMENSNLLYERKSWKIAVNNATVTKSVICTHVPHWTTTITFLAKNSNDRTKALTLPALKSEQLGGDGCPVFASCPTTNIVMSMPCRTIELTKAPQGQF